MKHITFNEEREFDYGHGKILHASGDVVLVHKSGPSAILDRKGGLASIREDKAQRWLTRGAARADLSITQGKANDDAMEGSADLGESNGDSSGERAIDESEGGKSGSKDRAGNRRK